MVICRNWTSIILIGSGDNVDFHVLSFAVKTMKVSFLDPWLTKKLQDWKFLMTLKWGR
jgi:hypothetical protein